MTWLVLASEVAKAEAAMPPAALAYTLFTEPVEAEPAGIFETVDAEADPEAAEVIEVEALGIMTKVKVPVIWHSLSQMS